MNVSSQTFEEELLSSSEESLNSAFDAMLEAEASGANVTGLLRRLNQAAAFLSNASMCFRKGNVTGVVYFVQSTNERLNGVEMEASKLTDSAKSRRAQQLSFVIAASTFGVCFVAFTGFIGWSYVKRRFIKRILEMELSENDEHQ